LTGFNYVQRQRGSKIGKAASPTTSKKKTLTSKK